MKKIISYILFGIFSLFFGVGLIGDLASISELITLVDQGISMVVVIVFILDVICCVGLLIYSIFIIKNIKKFTDEQNFKASLFLMIVYQGFALVESILLMLFVDLFNSSTIVSFLILLISFIVFLYSLVNKKINLKVKKILSLVAYVFVFIITVNTISINNVILFLATVFGVIQTLLVNIELEELLNNLSKDENQTSLRLKKLNELYEEKLISEEEYNAKRKEIIDNL